jgi:hypothetical protein
VRISAWAFSNLRLFPIAPSLPQPARLPIDLIHKDFCEYRHLPHPYAGANAFSDQRRILSLPMFC